MSLRLAFMGSPDFSVKTLERLVDAGHEIAAVYTRPPRPRSRRGLKIEVSPVHEYALEQGLNVYTPKNFKNEDDQVFFQNLNLDAAIIVAYGVILPETILKAPRLGCYNLHASLLPRWRGAAPIQRAIMANDQKTGAMVMKMDKGLDEGPILSSVEVPIEKGMTAGLLSEILANKGASLMGEAVTALEQGLIQLYPQKQEGIVYAAKISKEEARISWQDPALIIEKKICGLSPFPGAYCEMDIKGQRERIKLLKAVFRPACEIVLKTDQENLVFGQICSTSLKQNRLVVACGDGNFIEVLILQKAGGKIVTTKEFLQGHKIEVLY